MMSHFKDILAFCATEQSKTAIDPFCQGIDTELVY